MNFDLLRHDVIPLGLIAGALICFVAYWLVWSGRDTVSLTGAWVKAGAAGLVALMLLLDAALFSSRLRADGLLWLMPLGLFFGALGDFALARPAARAFLAGMAAFALGHLLYAFALWQRTADLNDQFAALGAAAHGLSIGQGLALAGLLGLLISTEFWLAPKTGTLRWPVRGYVLVIGVMAAVAILLVEYRFARVVQAGAALFVLSDLLLALRLFVVASPKAKRVLSLMLWPAYWCGQMLLMLGALGYWTLLKG
ncbi:hypothetical protein EGN72_16475 [Pseudorhodobacter sp. E13]|uniref:lysoplasmalogenase family protein n=1 Tax=Pseudorhodobacter sp. E13 TaxID=2487931 RepID=UPI000F8DCC71|nr:lysoplasmalogenase family protein [Pseudorhodobacter sp. E13]RUS58538.1 hypothetical protein EGN72_16475 [Pseudorhodobacter sp. E13]